MGQNQMTRCDEGHFYDPSQNATCPFCGVGKVEVTKRYEKDDERTAIYNGVGAEAKGDKAKRPQGAGDPEKTVSVWSKGGGIDPVVGWLICHEGANQGRDYRIRSGYNTIGRDTSSQICIAGDDTIARIGHAKLFYDLKSANFYVIAGSGRSGIYVNDEVVLQSSVLKAYDVIEVGATRLIFVPFCGDRFRWDMSQADAAPQAKGREARSSVPRDDAEDPGG